MTPSLGSIAIDVPVLLETRMLIQSNSGGGKSFCLRRVLEQTASRVQQIVLDPEGEFATLREKFDYIVCAPHGADAIANPATAAALARALWESGASAIVDIYELKAHERTLFVKRFCEALVNAPKKIWHPTMVVLDEIHMFAPQAGQAESTGAVIDLATRGRKRGLALIGATQRLSKLHKDVAAELLNKLIGRTGLDVDVQRAADELGMNRKDAMAQLRDRAPGEFFAFGPALTPGVELTVIGNVVTTHPKTGQRLLAAPPPASRAVLAKLQRLEGLQREAAEEAKTIEGLQAELSAARRQLAARPAPERVVEQVIDKAALRAVRAAAASLGKLALELSGLAGYAREAAERASPDDIKPLLALPPEKAPPARRPPALLPPASPPPPGSAPRSSAEQRVLDSLAWWAAAGIAQPTRRQVAYAARYTVNGHFNNIVGALRGRGLLELGPGTISLTAAGSGLAAAPEAAPSRDELISRITGVLRGEPIRRVFASIVEAGEPLSREELAERSGYTVNGHFNNLVGSLSSIGVIDTPSRGKVALSPALGGIR